MKVGPVRGPVRAQFGLARLGWDICPVPVLAPFPAQPGPNWGPVMFATWATIQ